MVRAVKSLNERLEEIEEEEEEMQQIQRSEVAEAVNEHEEAGEEIHMRLYQETGQLEMTVTSEDFEETYYLQETDDQEQE